jgi:signal transduction histidine kinase
MRPGLGGQLLVAGGMAVYVLAVYWIIVVGGGALLDSPPPSLPLAVPATAMVAVTFEPVRRVLSRRMAASPYELLARFTTQVSGAVATEELAPRMAALIGEGTGARRVEVWLRRDGSPAEEDLAARWPPGADPIDATAAQVHRHDVIHAGELVGRIVRDTGNAGGSLNPVEQRLLDDLLASAGLALRTLALTVGLQHRIAENIERSAEIRASRQRIVTAADATRRRLERDIHDGAQQHLVALAVNLSLATTVAGRDPARAAGLLADLRPAAETALATLAELSRGIYPRLLAESGLARALHAAWSTSPVTVDVIDETTRRFPVEVESAAYFGCLEAVQNAVKHAAASAVQVRLTETGGSLCFEVCDDGGGFDPATVGEGAGLRNMRDRVESLGGSLMVHSRPGAGTTVTGWIPLPIRVPAGESRG